MGNSRQGALRAILPALGRRQYSTFLPEIPGKHTAISRRQQRQVWIDPARSSLLRYCSLPPLSHTRSAPAAFVLLFPLSFYNTSCSYSSLANAFMSDSEDDLPLAQRAQQISPKAHASHSPEPIKQDTPDPAFAKTKSTVEDSEDDDELPLAKRVKQPAPPKKTAARKPSVKKVSVCLLQLKKRTCQLRIGV
ncbi:hypothetical protein BCR43DRAFT_459645 [Syncephalastrum racemosum]|uniref:Uncharacterized protein n=1 Tax=Syncephalastrum racemosum TaxID=13706 RepID=A0A1X2HAP2_SYNRA|nr:hypothetical protein BCR43DRAFT_459645 [Syncephalastrum racemosum]